MFIIMISEREPSSSAAPLAVLRIIIRTKRHTVHCYCSRVPLLFGRALICCHQAESRSLILFILEIGALVYTITRFISSTCVEFSVNIVWDTCVDRRYTRPGHTDTSPSSTSSIFST